MKDDSFASMIERPLRLAERTEVEQEIEVVRSEIYDAAKRAQMDPDRAAMKGGACFNMSLDDLEMPKRLGSLRTLELEMGAARTVCIAHQGASRCHTRHLEDFLKVGREVEVY